jgi:type II secretory ATPase GspE/PulE/Tfp pilus assembly ATPase PilB-like protein
MTGHQVYSTLHSNSAIGAIPRLLDIGILPDIMAGNITGIVAQRLVRTLCPHCKTAHPPNQTERELLGLYGDDAMLYQAKGCQSCHFHGYKGRRTIMEIFNIDNEIDELISHRASIRKIKHSALEKGFRPLAQAGIRHVIEGQTTIAEVSRVVDLTDRG